MLDDSTAKSGLALKGLLGMPSIINFIYMS